jgi:2',3'-cyclic-nucleotide 2'-phosphodiesterase (5'-nucleotidase family)
MVKLKNYNVVLKHFVLFLTFISIISCHEQKNYLTKIEGKKISITEKQAQVPEIENYIKPYREHIDKELSEILAYAPETLDKNGTWQTNIGNLLSDITLQKGNIVFSKRENKTIDICLLNHGGIRSILPKGNVTMKTAYQIMPFENSLYVMGLKGAQIQEMVTYIIAEKKPHPLSGMTFTIDKNDQPKNILIQGKPIETDKIYYVGTSDYLSNGGDKMDFFKKNTASYDMNYKLRNILIDYFKDVDTIKVNKNPRIITE